MFFGSMAHNGGMALVVVMHLARERESALPQILAHSTKMPVAPIRSGLAIAPNRVYVLASGSIVTLEGGRLQLHRHPANARTYNRIDAFLASLAEDQGENAVAAILSGTGTVSSLSRPTRRAASSGAATM